MSDNDRSTKQCHSAFPGGIGGTSQHSTEDKKNNKCTHSQAAPGPILNSVVVS